MRSARAKKEGYSTQLVKKIKVFCKDGKLVIPKDLQDWAIAWYHHYLQHPRTTCLEETLCSAMYWKGVQNTAQLYIKKCHICQVNKWQKQKYRKLPAKIVITNPWDALCVDLIVPYATKGKERTQIDIMCVTVIDPAKSWFEIVDLLVSQLYMDETTMELEHLPLREKELLDEFAAVSADCATIVHELEELAVVNDEHTMIIFEPTRHEQVIQGVSVIRKDNIESPQEDCKAQQLNLRWVTWLHQIHQY